MTDDTTTTGATTDGGLGHERTLAVIGAWAERLAAVAADHPWSTPVPTCPEWDLGKLVRHTGRVHRHVAGLVRLRIDGPPDRDTVAIDQPDRDADAAAWTAWFREGAARLLEVLGTTEPATPMWSWGGDQHASFWSRRMAHETVIHAVDGLMAVGRDFTIEPGVAVDGLDEFLESMPRSPSFTARDQPFVGSGTVHLHATDDGLPEGTGEWMIEFTPDGFTFTHAHGKGDVAVRAPAETLELLALGRRSLPQGGSGGDGATAGVQLFGDSEVLDRFLAGAVFR